VISGPAQPLGGDSRDRLRASSGEAREKFHGRSVSISSADAATVPSRPLSIPAGQDRSPIWGCFSARSSQGRLRRSDASPCVPTRRGRPQRFALGARARTTSIHLVFERLKFPITLGVRSLGVPSQVARTVLAARADPGCGVAEKCPERMPLLRVPPLKDFLGRAAELNGYVYPAPALSPNPSRNQNRGKLFGVAEAEETVEPKVQHEELDPAVVERARAKGTSIVVLPARIVGDRSVYSGASANLVKAMRANGIDAQFLDPPEDRAFELKKSGELVQAGAYVLGIASAASWDLIKRVLGMRSERRISVTWFPLEDGPDQKTEAWKVEGDTSAVLKAIEQWRARQGPESVGSPEESKQPSRDSFPASGSDADLRDAYRRQQVAERRESAHGLLSSAQAIVAGDADAKALARAEEEARAALGFFASSLDWAEDSSEEDEAHRQMDVAGKWVRQTFGCNLKRSGTEYQQTCPVALAHNRLGFSVGGYATRICSLCGNDLSECQHESGTAYLVPGGPEPLGWCRVCLKDTCEHSASETYRVSVVGKLTDMRVEEISLVHKPAQPEARILAMSVTASDLRELLGDEFVPGIEVSCDRCLLPCGGLIKHHAPAE
jgi:hypothetical protein